MNIQDTEIAHAVPQKKDNEVCSFGQFLVRSPMRSIAVAVCPNVIPKPQGLALSGLHHDARDIRDTAQGGNGRLQETSQTSRMKFRCFSLEAGSSTSVG